MALKELIIRPEIRSDRESVFEVNALAFDRENETRLVDALRPGVSILSSLVAELNGVVIGHVLFTAIRIEPSNIDANGAGLGPVAVRPEYHNMGVGSQLIETGLKELKTHGIDYCVVLGHSDYYPRFGFNRASSFGLSCQWDVPEDVFMAMELQKGALSNVSGTVYYAEAFNEVT